MIKRYIFTHPKIEGEIHFEFYNGFLVEYSFQGQTQIDILKTLLKRLPLHIDMISEFSNSAEAKWTEIKPDLTFDKFWNAYDHKVPGSSKKDAEAKWKKLSDLDKQRALKYITIYNSYVGRTGIGKKYAETYLSQRPWDK